VRFRALAAVVVVVAAFGCESKVTKRAKKLERRGDAPPVVVIDREVRAAAQTAEKEPNEEIATAMAIKAPAAIRGTLASADDVDVYKISIEEPGTLRATVAAVEKADLVVEILAGDKVLFRSDRGGVRTSEGFPNLPVAAGQVLFLRVKQFVKKKRKRKRKKAKDSEPGRAPEYRLEILMGGPAAAGFEAEPNSDREGAKELLLGDRGQGYIGWASDRDAWLVSLLGFTPGHSLDVDVRGVPGVALSVTVENAQGKAVVSRQGGKGQDVIVRSLEPGKGPSHYTLKVSGKRSNPVDLYTVSASSRRFDPGDEIEPNNTAENATTVADAEHQSGEARGHLLAGDKDYLRLPAPKVSGVLNLELRVPSKSDLKLSVVQGTTRAEANAGGAGLAEKLVGVPVEAGRQIIVVVSGKAPGDALDPYVLKWEFSAENTDVDPDEGGEDTF